VNSISYTNYSVCAFLVTTYWSDTDFFWIQHKMMKQCRWTNSSSSYNIT
jgi:hypothetical protein